jgi:hypothetical protein
VRCLMTDRKNVGAGPAGASRSFQLKQSRGSLGM